MCIIVENEEDIAAFKDFKDDESSAPQVPFHNCSCLHVEITQFFFYVLFFFFYSHQKQPLNHRRLPPHPPLPQLRQQQPLPPQHLPLHPQLRLLCLRLPHRQCRPHLVVECLQVLWRGNLPERKASIYQYDTL